MENNTCIRQFADLEQISNCKDKLKAVQKSFNHLSNILALTGNEVRLKIVYLLEEEGELCPCDLADIFGMSIPAISQHLRKLKDGNLIISRRDAQTLYYSLTLENLKILKSFFKYINQKNLQMQPV